MTGIHVGILGRPVVRVGDDPVDLSGLALALVTRLAVDGRPVAKDRLIADLWRADAGTDGAFRVLLTRTRRVLPDGAIARVAAGYELVGATCDADDFERLAQVVLSPSATAVERAAVAHEALAMWNGPALDGLEDHPWAATVAARLERRRETILIERFVVLAERDRLGPALLELQGEVSRAPTNERLAALLAVQLYREGQQAEALAVIKGTRTALRDQLGLRPGPQLTNIETQILNHDRTLLFEGFPTADAEHAAVVRSATALARVGAYDDARAVLQPLDGEELSDELAAEMLLVSAQVASMTGSDDADLLAQVKAIARANRDGSLLARAAMVGFGKGISDDKTGSLTELLEATALLPPVAREHVDLMCVAAVVVMFTDASDTADRLVEEAERVDARIGSPESRAALLITKSIVGAVRQGPTAEVIGWADEAYELAQRTEDPRMVVMAIQALLRVRYAVGDITGVDELLGTLEIASRAAMVPFGIVRAHLCRTMNAIVRGDLRGADELLAETTAVASNLQTHIAQRATLIQHFLLLRERDALGEHLPLIRALVAQQGVPSAWNAVAVLAGDDEAASNLRPLADHVPRNETFAAFVALATEASARFGDCELAAWCADELSRIVEVHPDATVMSGFGTAMIGFATHFLGVALGVTGDLDAAEVALEQAIGQASHARADLWLAHSEAELAVVLSSVDGRHDDVDALVTSVRARPVTALSPRLQRRLAQVTATP